MAAAEGESATVDLTVDELAARAGVTVRTIRFYGTRGLLPPPRIGPRRVGRYGSDHLARLALVEELREQGMTLSAIERHLRRLPEEMSPYDLAIHRAMVASWMPDSAVECTRDQVEERVGRPLGDDELRRLAAMGVVTAAGGPGAELYLVDPALVGLGVRLLGVPLSDDSLRAARDVMAHHSSAVARELSALFRDEIGRSSPQDDARVARAKSLSVQMQPLVLQALLTAFQRSLNEELRDAFPPREPRR
ncbi:MerR family transcriptional regulator [Streptomyces tsukubensis]|uniref:Transcriptional regulator n=1 Tax=Streptomyces tsukubensis TaxID=83656 RepID=A0A1V4AE94_9ACTN|nr:MerR family transcriptional regulator [Streptomyces tsukubensis]OON81819.1 transcriptional regulator [Streptomyces tsukubensis]